MNPIPYGRQSISDHDIEVVTEVLKADYLTQGPRIKSFEDAFAQYVGSKFAVAVANGTAALHLSCLSLKVAPGQKVITSPITFAASANCVRYCGGEVVFADIEADTYLLSIESVRSLLENAPPKTYAGIIPVDFAGRCCNMEAWRQLAKEYDLWLLEDACHAPGGWFYTNDRHKSRAGSGEYADLAIFSFHPVKHIAAGEGGMITTNDEKLYNVLLQLRTHGISRNQSGFANSVQFAAGIDDQNLADYPAWYMEMQDLGYNYRLTDFQAALGESQLKRAEEGIERRRAIAKRYDQEFREEEFILGQSRLIEGHAYHLYVIEVEDRLGLYNHLRANSIYAQIHYIPCHLMPYYRQFGWKEGDLPVAEKYYQHCLSLPMYPTLTDDEQAFVIDTIKGFYNQ